MAGELIYVTLQQFCERDVRPRRLLEEAGFTLRFNTSGRRMVPAQMCDILREVDGVLAGVEPYDEGLLAALPKLRCISRCGVGTDSIDLEAARRRGIAVYNTAAEVIEPVAQMTLAMMLALARHFPAHLTAARQGQWQKQTGVLLSEWVIGLVGFGRIGQAVERLLRPFGPRVVVADPACRAKALPPGVEWRELDALLAEADLVSLHAGRRPQEGPLLGARELTVMKAGSFLVNTARGFLIDEQALYEAVRGGHLAGAALDVYSTEPYTGLLTQLPTVLTTPHVASLTRASRARMEWRCASNVVEHFRQHAQAVEPSGWARL